MRKSPATAARPGTQNNSFAEEVRWSLDAMNELNERIRNAVKDNDKVPDQ